MAKAKAQDALARSTASAIAAAFEAYAADNNGAYPFSEQKLVTGEPSYLDQAHHGKTISGYKYTIDVNPENFRITAEPENCNISGTKIIVFDTASGLNERDCGDSRQSDRDL